MCFSKMKWRLGLGTPDLGMALITVTSRSRRGREFRYVAGRLVNCIRIHKNSFVHQAKLLLSREKESCGIMFRLKLRKWHSSRVTGVSRARASAGRSGHVGSSGSLGKGQRSLGWSVNWGRFHSLGELWAGGRDGAFTLPVAVCFSNPQI